MTKRSVDEKDKDVKE